MPEKHVVTLELTPVQVGALRNAVAYWASERHNWRMDRLHAGDAWAIRPTAQELAAEQVAALVWEITEGVPCCV